MTKKRMLLWVDVLSHLMIQLSIGFVVQHLLQVAIKYSIFFSFYIFVRESKKPLTETRRLIEKLRTPVLASLFLSVYRSRYVR